MSAKNDRKDDLGLDGLILFVAAEQALTVLVAVGGRAAVIFIGDPYRHSATRVLAPVPWYGTSRNRSGGKPN